MNKRFLKKLKDSDGYRQPETPEELEVLWKHRKIGIPMWIITICFFSSILIIVPKVPDSAFYLELDAFLDKYLLGHMLPKFSDRFYFSMKVAWCISFIYQFVIMVVLAPVVHLYLGRKGFRILLSIYNFEKIIGIGVQIGFIFFLIVMMLGFFYIGIKPYAFGSDSHLTALNSINMFFYGNFIRGSLLFLCMQTFFIFGMLFLLLIIFYYYIFCTGEYRL